MSYRKTGKTAWLKQDQSSKPVIQVTIPDDLIFRMVDDGIEDVCLIFKDARFFATLDDWLERKTDNGLRRMPLSLMDRR